MAIPLSLGGLLPKKGGTYSTNTIADAIKDLYKLFIRYLGFTFCSLMRFYECHGLCFEHFCWSPLADVTVFGSPATPSFTFTYLGLFLLIVVIIFQQSKASDEQNQHKASKYWSNFAAGVLLCHCVTTLISFQTRPPYCTVYCVSLYL